MKKILALILMGMMCVYMTACATTKTTNKDQTDSDGSKKTAGQKDSNQNLSDMIKDATIDETVLVDENNIKITATELEYNTSSVDLKLKIENNTDKNLSFISNSLGYSCNSVNDYMISDGYLNCDVTSGKAANDSLSISYDSLLIYGINEIADIEIGFDIVDEDYDSTYTGPKKIMTSAAKSYDYKEDSYRKTIKSDAAMNTYHYTVPYFTDDVLYSQAGVEVLSGGYMLNEDGETIVLLEVKNSTDQSIAVAASNIYVNGLGVCNSIWSASTVNPEKTAILDVNLSRIMNQDSWEAYGIEKVETVSLMFTVTNDEGDVINTASEIALGDSKETTDVNTDGKEVYNANDVRILLKKIVEDDSDYSGDMDVLLLVENNTKGEITVSDVYDSFSMNNIMMDAIMYSATIKSGFSGAMRIQLSESDLEEQQITSVEDIQEMEISLDIANNQGKKIDSPTVKMSLE